VHAQDVRHVGVVGCGLMGSGIVEVCARAGLGVTFAEGSAELIEAGRARVVRSLDGAVAKGKLDDDARAAALGLIDAVDDVAGLGPVDLVIEAATEDPDAKRMIFGRLSEVTREDVVLASNTSSIPIATLGEASARPDRVIGMHFFNPVPVMGLIELTPSDVTSDDTFELVRAFGTEILGKTCVRSSDEAGFIAMRLHERGFATREDIDTAIQLGLAHPMGPLRLSDLIGLDTVLSIGEVLHRAFAEERYEAPAVLRSLVADGKLGRKSGEGFYTY
jgi:3-hydroxybutyryl-CoA dehydrogenase